MVLVTIFDFAALGTSAKDLAPFEEKLKALFSKVAGIDNKIVLLLSDEDGTTHMRFCVVGRTEPLDAKEIMKKLRLAMMEDPELRALMEAQYAEYGVPLVDIQAAAVKPFGE